MLPKQLEESKPLENNYDHLVAVSRCGYKEEDMNPGDPVPKHWPKEVVDYLISTGDIVERSPKK